MSPTIIQFKVQRSEPEFITPSKPTPHEFKSLSDIDDQDMLRLYLSSIRFHPSNLSMSGLDPAKVIRRAIAETLVYYYPLAGRLREVSPSRKLIVECTGEGVLFVEADVDVTIDQFGYPLAPPFPCCDQLLIEVPEPLDVLNRSLLQFQVTRFKCGGFTLAYSFSHTMMDAAGIAQFMSSMAELAKGATSPSVLPTWQRHIFSSRNPAQLTCPLPEYNIDVSDSSYSNDMVSDLCYRPFFFGPKDISTLCRHFGHISDLRHCTSSDLISACVLKCRVVALQPQPEEEIGLTRVVNLRRKFKDLVLPAGYYGNAIVSSTSTSKARDILLNPLRVVRNAMDKVTKEYVQDVIDFGVANNRKFRHHISMKCYVESNVRNLGLEEVDFGWGKALYAGSTICSPYGGFYTPFKDGLLLPFCLPKQAMQRFVKEMNSILEDQHVGGDDNVLKSKM